MTLNSKQKKFLRASAHKLKPVVIVGGAGLTDTVLNEIETSIEHHELIKVKINAATRDDRQAIIDRVCRSVHAELVNHIGHIATFYRAAAKPSIKIP
ncbi:MAG TPA: ribosome assembly RNA-binding protein YhbY [Gammaproteobacteria bacterium]